MSLSYLLNVISTSELEFQILQQLPRSLQPGLVLFCIPVSTIVIYQNLIKQIAFAVVLVMIIVH